MFDLSSRNPLVNVKPNQLWLIDNDDFNNAQKVYKKQQFFLKEYALQTTLLVSHFIKWKHPNKEKFYTSPLLICPVKVIKDQKINLSFIYEPSEDGFSINPIIENVFKTLFNINLKELIDENNWIEKLTQTLEINGSKVAKTNSFSDLEQWEIITINAIGTFNYKKAILAQDYEVITPSPNTTILNVLGEQTQPTKNQQKVDVVNVNQTQKKSIAFALNQNLVIQGPPGTGKSNTIVELIKQHLTDGKKILFVSEKKSALDIVYQKLEKEKLNLLSAYFDGSKQQKKQFYQHLKKNISFLQNGFVDETNSQTKKIEEIESFFNTYLSITKKDEQQNVSIKTLLDELILNEYSNKDYKIKTNIPTYILWDKYQLFLEEIEIIANDKFNVKTISEVSFINLNKAVFTQNQPVDLLSKRLKELKTILTSFSELDAIYNLNWSWSDWSKHSIASSILQMANQSQLDILDPNSKKYKSFNTWTKKYELLKHQLKLADELNENWKFKPKFNDIDALIDELENHQPSFFDRFKPSRIKTVFKNYKQEVSTAQKIKVLNQLKNYYQLKHQFEEITIKLKHNLGILNPDVEINQLLMMRQKLESNSHQQYVFLLEHPQSLQLIEDLHLLHPKIQQANQIKRFLFNGLQDDVLADLKQIIHRIEQDLPLYNYYLPEIKKLLGLPSEIQNYIRNNGLSIHQLSAIVVYNTFNQFIKFEPHLKNISGTELTRQFKILKQLKTEQNKHIVEQILSQKQNGWKTVESLLQTPSSKLKTPQKELKKNYKQAKKIIFHESGKQQQHLPIKSLIEQTKPLIFDLLPIWIMNPLTIAESLPCQPHLFDVVIFDEASQIPLEDSLPAVYRSKQIVVVGDSKQMPPSQFFTHSKETVSLLMEAESNLKSTLLTTHYRSHHPKLMQFSNQQFYDNELSYFPPSVSNPPFIVNYIKNGCFENGKNQIEAKAVAQVYHQHLKSGKKEVGIIAFSQEQEQEIIKQINALNLPENKQLTVRNLENTQGLEKEYIIISIGYGYNKDGVFRQHFGPINQSFGANRLNVLLTRAQKQITICTSIKSSDFKWTENRGVNLLKDYLSFVEQNHHSKTENPTIDLHLKINNWFKNDDKIVYYPSVNGQMVNCWIDISNSKLLLIDPCLNTNETNDIYTLLDVVTQRFSKTKTLLSFDYFENPKRFKKEVLDFFKG